MWVEYSQVFHHADRTRGIFIAADQQYGRLEQGEDILDRQVKLTRHQRKQRVLAAELMGAGVEVLDRLFPGDLIAGERATPVGQPPQERFRAEKRVGN